MNGVYTQGAGALAAYPQAQIVSAQPGPALLMSTSVAAPPPTPQPSTQPNTNTAPLVAKQENGLHFSSDRINTSPDLESSRSPDQPITVSGVYAFQDEPAGFNAELLVQPTAHDPLNTTLHFVLTANHGTHVLKKYSQKDLKDAHFFIVSNDGSSFRAVHPQLHKDGEFVVPATFTKPGIYHLYAEVTPEGEAHEAFHFDFPVDAINQQTEAQSANQKNQSLLQRSAPYTVHLNTRTALDQTPLRITIDKASKRATEPANLQIEGYFFNRADWSYSRVTPTLINAVPGASHNTASFDVPTPLKPGNYRLWLRFSDRSHVHAVSYQISTTTQQ